MRRWTLTAIALLSLPRGAPAQSDAPVIDSIIIVTRNVFDSADAQSNFLFRLANAIHFTTRPAVVRQELLFREGERYDSALVEETLRNLRRRGLFRDVKLDTVRAGDRVNVLVQTLDGWTTELMFNLNTTADTVTWSAGLSEGNFLGTGARVGGAYRREPNRSAVTLRAGLDRIGGTRFGFDAVYDDLSDGRVGVWSVGAPFRAFSDPFGYNFWGQARDQRVLQFRDGQLFRTYQRRVTQQNAWYALAFKPSASGYTRFGVTAQVKEEEYVLEAVAGEAISDTVSGTVGLYAELARARYKVVTHYDGFARDVDIDLSSRVILSANLAPAAFGYESAGIGPRIEAQTGVSVGRSFARVGVGANGLFNSAGLDSGQVWIAATVASRFIPRHATVFHIEAARRRGTPPGSEYALGHGLGPRAFGPNAFTGNAMVWAALEHRWFLVDEVMGLLGVGLAAFADYGGAWYAGSESRAGALPVPAEPRRFGGDVGLGLRLGATRSTGQNVGRMDLAYRFGEGFEGGGGRWVFSFGRGFAF